MNTIESRLQALLYEVIHDKSLKPTEAFRIAGIIAIGMMVKRATFIMSVRSVSLAMGVVTRTVTTWRKTLPNKYIATYDVQIPHKVRSTSTGQLVEPATTVWEITGYPAQGLNLTDWTDRMLPSDLCWVTQGHNSWRSWCILKFDGPMTTKHLSNLTGIPVNTLSRTVRVSLLNNGLLETEVQGRELLWKPLNPPTPTLASVDLAKFRSRELKIEQEREAYAKFHREKAEAIRKSKEQMRKRKER